MSQVKTRSYRQVHDDLKRDRGSASTYTCEFCQENPALDWAYMYQGTELIGSNGRKYSENIWDYAPLCRKCHIAFDNASDPSVRIRRWEGSVAAGSKPKTPEHTRKVWETRKKLMEDPEVKEDHHKKYSNLMTRTNSSRLKCKECGYENNAGNLGWHRKKTGHSGTEAIPD